MKEQIMESGGLLAGIIRSFQNGDFWLYPIALCFFFTIGLSFERAYRLWFSFSIDGRSFMAQIHKFILANDISGAIKHCANTGDAALPRVIKAGLQRADLGEQQIQNAIDTASLDVIPKLDRRLSYLSLIANVATLLGLLGTISGLITAFAAVANADAQARQAILSAGISEAMNATAFGLVTAILAMVAHSLLSARSARLVEDVDHFGVMLMDLLSVRRQGTVGQDMQG